MRRRHRGDVERVQHGDGDARERLAHHVVLASRSRQRSALDMNANGRRIVHAMPEPFTAASERSMYAVTALLVSPLAAELPDSSTTRSTPASRIAASTPSMSS